MPTCSSCGQENPEQARFCNACGSPLAAASPPQEVRKTVTLVFSDVAGSTAMGEGRDPEAIRAVMQRYFAEMRRIVERHGGIVEKFVGDAVMAAFGIPVAREDDPLRAVRAAGEMRDAIAVLNDEFDAEWGVRLNVRIGVNTGPVVAGDASTRETFATGDTVNTAARLEQNAPPGEVLLGASTYRLVRDAATVEPVEPLTLKGKAEPVPAYRLVEVGGGPGRQAARSASGVLVGRETELAALREELHTAITDGQARLVTVMGPAGVGKSTLVEHFLHGARAEGVRILVGRCLSYGEGITFWPVTEILRQAAAIGESDPPQEARAKLSALMAGTESTATVADRLAGLLGFTEGAGSLDETFWSVRTAFQHMAAERPLAVLVEDLHWAEPTLLDLLADVAARTAGAVLVVGSARPELLAARPAWPGPDVPGRMVGVEPLSDLESVALVEAILGGSGLDPRTLHHIQEAAGGNPLFLVETLSMLVEEGHLARDDGRWRAVGTQAAIHIPATITGLLESRLDHLPVSDRDVVTRASVIGKEFHLEDLAALWEGPAGPPSGLDGTVARLAQREFVIATDDRDGFAFRHVLIRDAAYETAPKRLRAELHARFADWLEGEGGHGSMQLEEILGYHLERAYRYRAELAPVGDPERALAARASALLLSSGRRAFDRSDLPAAVDLLDRALDLASPEDPGRSEAMLVLGQALAESGRLGEAERAVRAAAEQSERPDVAVRARLQLLQLELFTEGGSGWFEKARSEAIAAVDVLEAAGDHAGLAEAFFVLAMTHGHVGRHGRAWEYLVRGATEWRLAGDPYREARILTMSTGSATFGPMPATEAIAWCETVLERVAESPFAVANTNANLGMLLGFVGDFDRGRELIEEAGERLVKLGVLTGHAGAVGLRAQRLGELELLAGRPDAAERAVRPGVEASSSIGDVNILASLQGTLAEALQRQGRLDEAEALARRAVELSAPEDVHAQVWWRAALSGVLAQRGEADEAVDVARGAADIVARTDVLWLQGTAWMALGLALARAGRTEEARDAYLEALARLEAKGIGPGVEQVRRELAKLS